jgi:peptidoglycan/xylan/chitin deacetylase (PgdA/CDA1 family)
MEFLARHGFYTPPLAELLNGTTVNHPKGKRPIIITFDDGYRDNYENAFPVLREFGFSAIVFLVSDFSRRTNWWDRPQWLGNTELLQPHQIQSMRDSGIEFGEHSFSHRSLPGLNDHELDEELVKGRTALEAIVQDPLPVIAYPYGDVDERVKKAAKRAGYACGFAAHTGPLKFYSDLYEIRRIIMINRSDWAYLNFKFSGTDRFIRWGVWLVKNHVGRKNNYHY